MNAQAGVRPDGRAGATSINGGNIVKIMIGLAALIVGTALSSFRADETERELFTFSEPEADRAWQTVNDGVMGGRSVGRFRINDDYQMEFYGRLSLANNGGFASVRSESEDLGLQPGDVLVARVRGDGREYTFNLYTPERRTAFSFRAEFATEADEWVEVRLPLDTFVATSFGRELPNEELDPARVDGLGILLGDKREGPFKLEVDWIKVVSDE